MLVEPWLQTLVSQLVNALGEPIPQGYKVGDEAAGCLLDLKKWLLNYDTKMEKWDVAAAIATTTLVDIDLVQILATYGSPQGTSQVTEKIALLALELVGHLTWPMENGMKLTKDQAKHLLSLRNAQKRYKRAIVSHPLHSVFRAVIKLTLPSAEKSHLDRTTRDKGILNLCFNFVRNVLAIDGDDRSEAIQELSNQKMLEFLIVISASKDPLSSTQAVPMLEVLWSLLNGVDPANLYNKDPANSNKSSLSDLLQQENAVNSARFKSSRHSRFGTMYTIDVGNKLMPISGQAALSKDYLQDIDSKKSWRKPKGPDPRKKERVDWDIQITLSTKAQASLARFVEAYLKACYNLFFGKCKGFLNGFTDEFDSSKIMHYLYLLGWFATAERLRSNTQDFKLIGVALSYSMFTVVCDTVTSSLEAGPLQNFDMVHAGMVCMRGIFTAIDEMTRSSNEWKDVAENMLSRLFYDEIRLDMFSKIPRTASKRTLSYQSESIELIHSLFRLLDYYSSDKAVLFVKSRRRKKAEDDGESDGEDNGVNRALPKAKERKWDVDRYVKKFYHSSVVDIYENAIRNYEHSSYKVLKHCLAFLHRLFIKKEMKSTWFRLSFIGALLKATEPTHGIVNKDLMKGYTRFTDYYTKRLFSSLDEHPSLYTELLFHKTPQDALFYDQGIISGSKAVPSKAAAAVEYEFTDESMGREDKIRLCVAALVEDDKKEQVEWILAKMTEFAKTEMPKPKTRIFCESSAKIKELFTVPLMRLLLKTIGLVFDKGRYFIPSSLDNFDLVDACEIITKALSQNPDEDPHNHLLRVTHEPHQTSDTNNEDSLFVGASDQSESENENGFNDPRLQPLSEEELAARKLAKKRNTEPKVRKKRQLVMDDDSDSDSPEEEDKQKRSKKAAPELKVYKSSAFVHDSDDEEDHERDRLFFERELQQRQSLDTVPDSAVRSQSQVSEPESESYSMSVSQHLSKSGADDYTAIEDTEGVDATEDADAVDLATPTASAESASLRDSSSDSGM